MKMKLILLFTTIVFLGVKFTYSQEDATTKVDENKVIIKHYYEKPASFQDKNTTMLKGVSEGEYIEIRILGSIKDFEHITLEMNNSGDIQDGETLHTFKQLTDQTLIINSSIPEGIPMEKIKWKSLSNKEYQYVINENGNDRQQVEFTIN